MNINERNKVVPHDTEDRNWWYIHGEVLEEKFVYICRTHLQMDAQINPEKTNDKTAPDLIVEGNLADLKTQNTPFFTANRYGIDPRFAITFNRKDYQRYKSLYPEIMIYFWIDWKQTSWKDAQINYLGGIFRLPFQTVARIIENGAPEHTYIHRGDPDNPNAKSSFLLDIRNFENLFSTDTQTKAFESRGID